MLYSDIKTKYKDEWILLGNPKYNGQVDPESGDVIFHDKDQDKVWEVAYTTDCKHITVVFGGDFPEEPDDDFAFII